MIIRQAVRSGAGGLARVFHDVVRQGPSPYTRAQREARMPGPPDPVAFAARIAPSFTMPA